jgi:riboflavin kinase/FMN adenylyltransferase
MKIMKIWKNLTQASEELKILNAVSAVTIGNFDGVHRGHQAIIRRTTELARQIAGYAIIITFSSHTNNVLDRQPPLLNQPPIRKELFSKQEFDGLLEIDFDQEFATLTPEAFFQTWLVEGLNARAVVVGYDFRFGAKGRGDFALLQKVANAKQILTEQLPAVVESGEIISSSKIRQLIMAGNIETANKMLGYPFQISGVVVKGEQRGRILGFRTANIHLDPEYVLPAYGVYIVDFAIEGTVFKGVASVGVKPTFGEYAPLIEVHLLDTECDLYYKEVRVSFLKYIRPEIHFPDADSLKTQIAKDVQEARAYINSFH